MKRFIIILSLFTIGFTQDGEIVDVQAAQRTDGSGIVDISYTLLPDDTFPSFEVSAYQIAPAPAIYYQENSDGNYDIYIANVLEEIGGLTLSLSCFNTGSDNWAYIPEESILYDMIENNGWIFQFSGSGVFLAFSLQGTVINPQDGLLFTVTEWAGDMSDCSIQGDHSNYFAYATPEGVSIPLAFVSADDVDGATVTMPIEVSGDGIGENIFPGTYNLAWQLPEDMFLENMIIRIKAEGYVIDSELPFEMVTIPPGTFYDIYNEQNTMDYSYEIMKFDLTNAELVEWALTVGEEACGPAYLQTLGDGFDFINYDGNVLEIEEGKGAYPAIGNISSLDCFRDYYGLRFPTLDEWTYAARGHNATILPWVFDDFDCYYNSFDDDDDCYEFDGDYSEANCMGPCFFDAFCYSGNNPFSFYTSSEDDNFSYLYPVGQYSNASFFGVYDMLGGASNLIITGQEEGDDLQIGGMHEYFMEFNQQSNELFNTDFDCAEFEWSIQALEFFNSTGIEDIMSWQIEEAFFELYTNVNSAVAPRFVRTVSGQ